MKASLRSFFTSGLISLLKQKLFKTNIFGCTLFLILGVNTSVKAQSDCAQAISVSPSVQQIYCQGASANPLVATITKASGSGPASITYEWFSNVSNSTVGGTLVQGPTTTTTAFLTSNFIPPTAVAGSLWYYCTVKNTDPTFCSGSFTTNPVEVVINSNLPVSVSIASSDPDNIICAGTSVTFTATPINGGTPTYQWQLNGLNIPGATGSTYTTTGLTSGQVVTVVMTSNASCASVTPVTSNNIATTVNPIPTVVVTNPTGICSPSTADLTAGAVTIGSTAGLTFTYWNDAAATSPYGSPSNAVAGTYYIKGTTAAGCSDIKSVTVTVNPTPTITITNPGAICAPATIDLTTAATTSGSTAGLTFTYWTDAAATSAYATPSTAVAGIYYIKGTTASGCFDIKPVTVTINPKPTVTITNPPAPCSPSTVDLTASAVTTGSTSGLTYTYWTDAGATSSYGTPSAAAAGTYYIKGTTASGCFDIQPVTVTINSKPTVTIIAPAATCSPSTVDLTSPAVTAGSTSGLTYSYWTDAGATSSYSTPTTAAAGTYYIKGTTVSGCFDIKQVIVTINPKPTVTITNPAAICSPSTVDLTAAAVTSGSTSGLTYTYWTDAGATSSYGTPSTAIAGTYYIKGTTASGCFDIKQVIVTINPKPAVSITNPAAVCSPSTVDLTVAAVTAGSTTGLTYTYWTDAAATLSYGTPTTAGAGTYYIKGITVSGCFDIKQVIVTINPKPTVSITNPAAVCSPSTVDLTAAAVTSGSTSGLTYTYWTDAAATVSYGTPTTAVAGTYYIKGTTASGCVDIKTVTVTVNAKPTVTITNPASVCSPSTVNLTLAAVTAGSTAGLTYTYWTDAAAASSYGTPGSAGNGTYYIKGTTAAGCFDIKSVTVTVNTTVVPSVSITSSSTDICSSAGTSVTFTAAPTNGGAAPTYQWTRNGTNIAGATNSTYTTTSLANPSTIRVVMTSNAVCPSPATVTSTGIVMNIYSGGASNISNNSISGPTSICPPIAGLVYTVTAVSGAASYDWSLPTGFTITSGLGTNTITVSVSNAAVIGNNQNVSVFATNPCGSGNSRSYGVNVNNFAGINAGPDQTVCAGSAVTLAAVYTGNTSGSLWSAATGTFSNTALVNSTYTPTISSGNVTLTITTNDPVGTCAAVNDQVVITVNQPPAITTQPVTTQTLCSGNSASFSVVATGTGLTYQWKKAGSDISGATSATLTLNNITTSDAGNYTVVVSGTSPCTSVTSSTSALIVNQAVAITGQPATTQTVCSGSSVSFTVTATGTGLSYQWRKGTTNIVGATGATLTINPVTVGDAANDYNVVITGTGPCTPLTSANAALVVNQVLAITTQPINTQTLCSGNSASFSVVATGTGLTYQWKKGGSDITGATSATLTLNNITTSEAGNYTVVVSGISPCTPVTSSISALIVNQAVAITTQPATTQTVCSGSSVSFTVLATGTGITYQWRKGTTNITGATGTTLTINPVTVGDVANDYNVVITGTGPCTPLTSANAALVVNQVLAITTQPVTTQTLCSGNTASFSVVATGTGLTYQWKKGGSDIFGATSATLTLNNITVSDAGNYTVVVSGASPCTSLTSSTSALIVNQAVAITSQPAPAQTVCSSFPVSFSVSATGTGITYQWYKNGVALVDTAGLIAGVNSNNLTIPQAKVSQTGTYTVIVSGASPCGTVTSMDAQLTVNQSISITSQPSSQTICQASNVSFTVAATGTITSYVWRQNGIPVSGSNYSGENTPTLNITNATAANAGNFDVVISSPSGICSQIISSPPAILTVNALPAITVQPSSTTQTLCLNATATQLSVTATGAGITYQWYSNAANSTSGGTLLNGATSSTYTPVTSISGVLYYYVIVSGTCTPAVTSDVSGAVTVNALPAITAQPSITTQTLCLNVAATQLSITAAGAGLTYQWYSNATNSNTGGTLLTGATSSAYTPVTTSAGTLYYYAIVSGTCTPPVTSNVSGAVTINGLPAIITQPATATQTPCLNATATQLSVTATGAGITYQWYSNAANSNSGGTLLNGATSSTYTPVTSTSGVLYYYVIVSGTCTPAVTSDVSGAVTVNALPAITAQPSITTQTLCLNVAATQLSITATGAGLTYQWYSNATNSNSGGTLLAGATTSVYTPVTTSAGILYYYAIVSGTCTPPVTSNVSGAVTVNALPAITVQPSSTTQTLCLNTTATQLSVTATGAGITYQWYSNATNSNSGGTLLTGATSSSYTPITSTSGVLYYYVIVNGTCTPAVTSNVSGAVTVNALPAITAQPSITTQTVCLNVAATQLSITAAGAGLTYQWYSNASNSNTGGTLLTGATSSAYTPVTTSAGILYYYAIVSGTCTPPVTSNVSGAITVNAPPAITSQPAASTQTLCLNATATQLSVLATGAGATYQWYSNTVNSNSGGTLLNGATSSAYTPVTTSAGTLYYYVIISGTCTPPVTSSVSGAVTVNTPPAITVQPSTSAQNLCINSPATQLSVTATGIGAGYQWYSNAINSNSGGTLIGGATSSAYTPLTTTAGIKYYYVVVSGTCAPSVTSAVSGAITVSAASVGGVVSSNQIICEGNSPATLNLTGNIGGVVEWQSAKDPNFITTITQYNITTASLTGSTIGALSSTTYFRAVIQNNPCSSVFSSVVSIAVNLPFTPVITASPASTICLGQTVTFTAAGLNSLATITNGDFSNANPLGWSGANANNNNGDPNSDWGETGGKTYSGVPYNSGSPSGPKFQIVNGTTNSAGNISILSSPIFSTVGRASASVEWYQGYNLIGAAIARVEISIDGGSTYSTLVQYTSSSPAIPTNPFNTKVSIDLSAYLGQPNMKVRFYYIGTTGSNWAIDDVNIVGPFQPLTYTWPAGFTVSGNSASITPSPPGTYNYTLTTSYGGCAATTTNFSVTVNPLPTITGTLEVCAGSTTQLAGSVTPAASTPWVSASTSIATVSNTGLVTGVSAGTSIITYKNSNGCTITDVVTVNARPAITGTLTVCAGTTTALSGSGIPSASTPWASAQPGVATVSSTGVVTGVAAGTSVITYTNSNGCTFTATVSVSDPATITTQPVTANFCLGSNATITVAASGTSVTYQWQVSTAGNAGPWTNLTNVAPYSGVTTNTLTVATPAITLATNFYRVIVNGNATCAASANSNAIALMYRNVWMGTTSSDWNTTSNWSDNQLPSTACPNVYIPNRANQPTLNTAPAPPGITNLIIDPGAILTVANYSATSLKIAGTITNNGTFDVRNGSLEFNGTSPQSIAGSYFFTNTMKNLKVSNTNGTNGLLTVSAAANDTLKITGEIAFGNVSNTTITTGDNIVLISNAVGTARVADVTNNGANSGNSFNGKVTVERFFTPSRSWRLVTAPVNNTGNIFNSWQIGGNYVAGRGMFVTGLNPTGSAGNGLDYSVYNNFSMKTYNPVSNNYVDIANTITQNLSTNSLNAGNIGYFAFIRGDRSRNPDNTIFGNANVTTLSAKGNLQTGTQTFNVTGGPGAFVLLGNPYASSIDFSKVAATNVNTRRFYVYDPTLSTVGAFVVMEDLATPGTFAPTNISISPQGNHIQSSQAFFVEVTGSGPSLTISENAKSANYNTAFFRPATPSSQIQSLRVNVLYVNADNTTLLTDGTFVQFDGSFNDKVDIQDALKFGNITESLSLLRYNKYLAVERRPLVTDNDTIFLQLSRSTQRNYRFQFIPSSFDPAVTAFLEDSFTGKQIPLNMTVSSNHDFAVTGDPKSAVINRFRIVFKAVAPGPLPVTFKSIKAYKQASHVNVEWTVENERNISRYEVERSVDGVTFVKANTTAASVSAGNSKTYNWLDTNPVYGNNFYRIRSVNLDGSFEYTNVVVVKLDKPVSGIRIYPNPVTNGIIGAEFKNMAEGIYKVRLLNNLGQAIFSKTVNHAQGTSLENIESNYKLIAGIYQLEVTSPTKEITMIKVIVK